MSSLRVWFSPALQALRLYWPAFLFLQICAGLTVVAYYNLPSVRGAADQIMDWRIAGGLWFVVAANIFSGAVVPETFKAFLRPKGRKGLTFVDALHLVGLMALLGIAVDFFYRFQARIFGEGFEWWRLLTKIAIDQFVYTLFFALPMVLIWFAWRQQGYSLRKTIRAITPGFFLRKLPTVFLPNLFFWVPALVALYALPTELQFVLFLFLNAAWCLVMIFVAKEAQTT